LEVRIDLHSKQALAYKSRKRAVLCCSGIQGGKSLVGALKLRRAIEKGWPAKEYPHVSFAVTAPDFNAMKQSTEIVFNRVFQGMGKMNGMERRFELNDKRNIFFRTVVKNPNSVEGIPDCAFIWADEAGQYPRQAFINIDGRTAFMQGQAIYTTTPYAMNWVKRELIDKQRQDPEIDYFRWRSIDNPAFPKAEYERQKRKLSPKEFRRKYEGIHERMEGLVLEGFNEWNLQNPFPFPEDTEYYGGIDWGFDHPLGLEVAAFPGDGNCYTVSIFKKSGLMPTQVFDLIEAKTKTFHVKHWFAGHDRPDMIQELENRGIPVSHYFDGNEAFREVNAGNQKLNELARENKWRVFKGIEQFEDLVDEIETYAWDKKEGEEYGKEQPKKENDDLVDAVRYRTIGTYHLLDRKVEPVEMPIDWKWKVDTFDPSKVEKPGDPMGY